MYLLGYISRENRLYLGDKELNVVSYALLLPVLEYQTAVMRADFGVADRILPAIPKEQRTRVAHFLEKQGYRAQALAVSTDAEHRFDLALALEDTKTAYELALEAQSDVKWKELAKLATTLCQFDLAQQCYSNAADYSALLLLATSSGNKEMVGKLSEAAREKGIYNAAFLSLFLLGDLPGALEVLVETERLPEAAFFARSYLPSEVPRVLALWKAIPAQGRTDKSVQALADPLQYENLFPNFEQALKAERARDGPEGQKKEAVVYRAKDYLAVKERLNRSPLDLIDQGEGVGQDVLSSQMNRMTVEDEEEEEEVDEEVDEEEDFGDADQVC